jgi:hypothetical protein
MVGTTTVSTLMVVILAFCLRVSTTTTFDTIGEVVLIQGRQCSIMRLPIGILYSAKCGCEYPYNSLFLV